MKLLGLLGLRLVIAWESGFRQVIMEPDSLEAVRADLVQCRLISLTVLSLISSGMMFPRAVEFLLIRYLLCRKGKNHNNSLFKWFGTFFKKKK